METTLVSFIVGTCLVSSTYLTHVCLPLLPMCVLFPSLFVSQIYTFIFSPFLNLTKSSLGLESFQPPYGPTAQRPNGSYLNLQIWSDKKFLEPVLWFFDDKPLYKFKYKFQKCQFMKKILTAPHPLSTSYSISSYLKSREHSLPL